jgi:hypothetical protein
VSPKASNARRGALLPNSSAPAVVHARGRRAEQLDVVLAIVPLPARAALFAQLPQSARWRALHARTPARSGTVRTTLLANRRHTHACHWRGAC